MSVNPGGGDGMVSYADHDVHHCLHEIQAVGGESNPELVSTREFEITERGLEPDEIAELRALRVAVGTKIVAAQPQDSIGTQTVEIGAGYNLRGDEFLQADLNLEAVDVDDDGDTDYQVRSRDTDEVGQIFTYFDTLSAPYDDDTNGNGGGGQKTESTEVIDMAELFGSGPFVDSADDFVSRIRANEQNQIQSLGVRVMYSLYYSVEETEGGRTRFGR